MKTLAPVIYISFCLIVLFSSCTKDKVPDDIDIKLYNMAVKTTGFTWYNLSDINLDKSSGSGHNFPFLRTRFNDVAATQLDVNGKVNDGIIFPEGSLIVKELINQDLDIERYAILYKESSNESADANGWVWGYINSDKTIAATALDKGAACISCHQQTGNIDQVLMNKFFP